MKAAFMTWAASLFLLGLALGMTPEKQGPWIVAALLLVQVGLLFSVVRSK